jgi:hypothetical protein
MKKHSYYLDDVRPNPRTEPPSIHSLDFWPTPHEIYRDLFKRLPPDVEVFDFGTVPDSILKKEAVRAAPLLARGLLDIPFERVMFRYMFIPDRQELLEEKFLPDLMLDEAGNPIPQPYCTLVIRGVENSWLAFDLTALTDGLKHRLGIPKANYTWDLTVSGTIAAQIDNQGECRWVASKKYYAQTHALPDELKEEGADRLLGGLADTIASFSLLLNAKNVPRRTVEPPAKVNAKRARNDKPLLTRITYIDGARYTTAATNTANGGSHSSPVPHLRRGHIRHRYGKAFWVRDCIVNALSRDEIDIRNQYNVNTDSLAKGHVDV